MDWIAGLLVAAALVAVSGAVGVVSRARSGRVREASAARTPARGEAATTLGLGADRLGDAATLVQFSTEYCARCPATARRLGALASGFTGLRHVEIDLGRAPGLADRFHVRQTPTVLVLDAHGDQVARIAGVPRDDDLLPLLHRLTGSPNVPAA
ncbi:thioredoxin family protein [Agromyces sp. G08B096]|uniref:Thioredoxin family protein n=1 Tax=Agromyces sp. G08B096 TaxID=3156399 RepID=A0AAU7W478_9MICO